MDVRESPQEEISVIKMRDEMRIWEQVFPVWVPLI